MDNRVVSQPLAAGYNKIVAPLQGTPSVASYRSHPARGLRMERINTLITDAVPAVRNEAPCIDIRPRTSVLDLAGQIRSEYPGAALVRAKSTLSHRSPGASLFG